MHISDKKTSWIRRCLRYSLFILPLLLYGFSSAAHSAPKTILVLGDSLSAEYGIVRGTGWVALMEARLKEKKQPFRVVNASISGSTTSGGYARLPALLKEHRPQILIIELGCNDGLRGLPVESVRKNLLAMIRAAQRIDCEVLLLGMQIPPNYGQTYTRQFADVYKKIAKKTHVALVPFFLKGVAERDDLFQPDRLHPVKEAQPIILDNVWPHLLPLLQ
ncbi:MAG: arylesterase [Burkholderiaceae bacterium]|jgi:acyl-CoA thioesterase-1|nr:arylesterase [Burkholderiaceae bacterium]